MVERGLKICAHKCVRSGKSRGLCPQKGRKEFIFIKRNSFGGMILPVVRTVNLGFVQTPERGEVM